ncbi:MAG: tol-pal system protein YbgF [Gammaproteobacteria bacterium]|jgi:tol-pal system protein YbgF|nr:tol-pal system protein YbgF [Gammaproteobacteria bacterium]
MNKTLTAAVNRILIGISASILVSAAAAQGTSAVVESQGFTPGQQAQSSSPSSNNDGLSLLLEQNQQLRVEVQALRALVEEQGFEIRKLQRDTLNRYTNVDDRLSSLEASGVASAATVPTINTRNTANTGNLTRALEVPRNAPSQISDSSGSVSVPTSIDRSTLNNTAAAVPNRNAGRSTLEPAVLGEQQLYQMAYDSVINSNFERSIAEFDQYLNIYPAGRFVTNAHYWKGQAYLYLNRYNEAKEAYEIILNQYDDSAKLPDAMYGLSIAYQGLGNIPQARQLLNEIKRRFRNTGAASLADTRLLQLD